MGILKTISKEKIRFLMDFDYNNVLGRLKSILGKEAYFFSEVRARQNDVARSTNDKTSLMPFMEASEVNGKYRIVLTGWGCLGSARESLKRNVNKSDENLLKSNQTIDPDLREKKEENAKNISSTTQPISKQELKTRPEGFFINESKTKVLKKEENNHTQIEIFKSIILVLLAAFIALVVPIILTGAVNRLVADITSQWYLNGFSRVMITVFVPITTYSIAYILIRFTTLRKSIVFNIVCFILTFIWSILIGIAWMAD